MEDDLYQAIKSLKAIKKKFAIARTYMCQNKSKLINEIDSR